MVRGYSRLFQLNKKMKLYSCFFSAFLAHEHPILDRLVCVCLLVWRNIHGRCFDHLFEWGAGWVGVFGTISVIHGSFGVNLHIVCFRPVRYGVNCFLHTFVIRVLFSNNI